MYRFMQDINRKHSLQLKVPTYLTPSTTRRKSAVTNE
jgi:hypothetical protein